jgi:tripartite-type tricarboxylate transporter receptor subunit TctC
LRNGQSEKEHSMRVGLIVALTAAVISVSPTSRSFAATDYPTRPITIIVPFAAGGVTDLLARMVAQKMGEKFGKPVTIENKGGAGTIVAAVATAKAEPDGHVLMLATGSTMSINRTLYKQLPYDADEDLTPVALVATSPFLLVTNPQLSATNVQELIKLAKERPGALNYGSGGVGATNSVLPMLMKSMTATDMKEVPYRGTTPALTDTIAGHIQFVFADVAAAEPLVKEGRVRVLGISSAQRFEGLPDVPTVAESGIPGFEGDSWQMIVAPAKTPSEVVVKLNSVIGEIVSMPEIRQQMIKLGTAPGRKQTPSELRQFINAETARWGKILTEAGVAHTQ